MTAEKAYNFHLQTVINAMTNYVVVGTSAAGLGAVIKLRQFDSDATITCLTAESDMPYNRCLLADLLAGAIPGTKVYTRGQDFFDAQSIKLVLDARVVSVDRVAKVVTCADGRQFGYDKLLIATGRSQNLPPISGVELAGVCGFYDLAHVRQIDVWCAQYAVKDAVVIGAGISGIECADALAKRGIRVHLLERAQHVLPMQTDAQGAAYLEQRMQQYGVTAYCNVQIKEIIGQQQVAGVQLADGRVLPAQLVVCATGGTISSYWATAAGLAAGTAGALLVNEYMQTNDAHIFAAGDVALVKDLATGQFVPSCLWPDAALQGMCAAAGMIGQPRAYAGTVQVTSSHVFGTTFVTSGPVQNPPDDCQQVRRSGDDFSHLFLLRGTRLIGFAMVGNIQQVGALRKSLLEGTPFVP